MEKHQEVLQNITRPPQVNLLKYHIQRLIREFSKQQILISHN
jgi:hypothetical protein